MRLQRLYFYLLTLSLPPLFLCACYHPPYNNFEPYTNTYYNKSGVSNTGLGVHPIPGRGIYKGSRNEVINELAKADIQFIHYGDTRTLIIPTDRYYHFNSPRLKELCYPALARLIKLLHYYPDSTFYIAGFTDNIGYKHHKNTLSQAQAETMLTFLWANGIQAQQLHAEGYGDKHAVSDNSIIHGSGHNRRIEIQWFGPLENKSLSPYLGSSK